jgi:Skp family chaperone for outer membrane proteins
MGTAHAQPGAPGAPPAAAPAAPATRPTVAVFNMAAVMRDFGQAKYQVWLLNNKKTEMSKNLLIWRSEYIQHQQDIQKNPKHPELEQKSKRMLDLARLIEDEDRKINKQLNDDASAIIGDLYDKMKTVVDKTAEMNGYHIVFAYPDAVTPEEQKSPYIKELKLKPPAAQPFFVAPHADITAVVVKTLNTWYPPLDAKGQLVDVTKLDVPNPGNGVPGPGPSPAPGPVPPK